MIEKPLDQMSSDELDNMRVEKEKLLKPADHDLGTVEQESHRLAKEILALRTKKAENDINLDKARHIVRGINSDIRIITSYFWSARKREGK